MINNPHNAGQSLSDYPLLLESGPIYFGVNPTPDAAVSWNLGALYIFDGTLSQADLDSYYTAGVEIY